MRNTVDTIVEQPISHQRSHSGVIRKLSMSRAMKNRLFHTRAGVQRRFHRLVRRELY